MTSTEKKTKMTEDALPKHLKTLRDRDYSNPDVKKLQKSILEQMEEGIFYSSHIWVDLDANKNGILDIIDDENSSYIFEGLPVTKPIRDYLNKITQYFLTSERQKEKLMLKLIDVMDYADTTREVTRIVPVDETKLDPQQVENFKSIVRSEMIAYKESKGMGKNIMLKNIKDRVTTQEKKVWINDVAMEVLGEELLK